MALVTRGHLINWIDTAAVYGLGHSETIVRRALEGVDQRPYLFTKAGLLDGGGGRVVNNLKRDSIRRELEHRPAAGLPRAWTPAGPRCSTPRGGQ